ncbi:MAG: hypothetical protein MZV70_77065 [Desulfobacterales bacterium]|nr:hypothetical protein [Desulfobacterales bacterium]
MSLVKEQSNFQYLGFQSGEFNLSVRFHLTFLNQEPYRGDLAGGEEVRYHGDRG